MAALACPLAAFRALPSGQFPGYCFLQLVGEIGVDPGVHGADRAGFSRPELLDESAEVRLLLYLAGRVRLVGGQVSLVGHLELSERAR